jgi:hypothetical protein
MMFLDCPAWMDRDGAVRCGLPAEVRCRFTVRSSGGLLDSAMIRCPAGHWFSGPLESLTQDGGRKHAPGPAGAAASAGPAVRSWPTGPGRDARRPHGAPAYYLGRPARLWITAMRPRRTPQPITR